MLLSSKEISQARNFLKEKHDLIREYSLKSQITIDPTRIKILLLLKMHKELCLSDLAKILGITVSAISYQMRILERVQLVKKVKMGKIICHSLIKGPLRSFRLELL